MSFAVVWNPSPTEAIDGEWQSSPPDRRRQIAEALEQVHRVLGRFPLAAGESREDLNTRVFSWSPVTVHYRVFEPDRVVRIFAATVFRRR